MDIAAILTRKYPEAIWTLNGDDYSGLSWLDDSPQPSENDLSALWPIVQAEVQAEKNQSKAARDAAIAHAKSLGFTDEMIAVMYPNLANA
jgi:hypothetical protein